ncbi:hypothetical protein GN156_33670, partial [bacterium LRH843]|nr:hypothetical protein [bacterium LRH843]
GRRTFESYKQIGETVLRQPDTETRGAAHDCTTETDEQSEENEETSSGQEKRQPPITKIERNKKN